PVKLDLSLKARANRPELDADVNMSGTLSYDLGKQQYRLSPLQINSVVRGRRIPGGKTDLSLSAAMLADFDKETASITDLKIAGLDTKAGGSIQIKRIRSATPAVQVRLDAAGKDLSLPFRILEIQPLASQLAGLRHRDFNFSTRLDADLKRGDMNIPELKAQLLGADIQGHVKASNIHSSTPAAQGDFTASGPDLPTLLQVLGQFQTGKDKTLARYGRQLSRVGNKAFALKANFDADMNSGDVNVPTLTVDGLGIHAAGNLKARDMRSGKGSIQGKLTVNSDRIGEVLVALDKPDLGRAVRSVSFDAAVSGDRRVINLKPMMLKMTVGGGQIPRGDLTLDAATHLNLDKQELDLNDLRLAGLGLNVHGSLHAKDIQKSPRYSGELKVNPFDLRKLMHELNMKPPETENKKALTKVAVDAGFSGTADEVNIPRLTVGVDKSTLKGSLAVKGFKQPAIQAKLDVDQINLDDYLPPAAKGKPVSPETAAGAATRLPVKTLRALDANVDLKAGHLVISRLKVADVVAQLHGKNGLIKLDPLRAKLYHGSYTGNIHINATGKRPKLAFSTSLKGVQMEPLLRDFTGKPAKLLGTSDQQAA
ncbi:MAG: AsmA family protein, partial [Gammaproteobacteria bacterium]